MTVGAAQTFPPTVTPAPVAKLVPVKVIVVPPRVEPVNGLTEVTTGGLPGGGVYKKPKLKVVVLASRLVTVTSTAPTECAGVTHVICEAESTLTAVQAAPPIVTVAPCAKIPPVIVTVVPPSTLPLAGEIDTIWNPVSPSNFALHPACNQARAKRNA